MLTTTVKFCVFRLLSMCVPGLAIRDCHAVKCKVIPQACTPPPILQPNILYFTWNKLSLAKCSSYVLTAKKHGLHNIICPLFIA